MNLTHGSLFTGLGGFDIAAHVAGFTNAFQCEIDPFCQALLRLRFPGVPLIGDVKDVTRESTERFIANANDKRQQQPQGRIQDIGGRLADGGKETITDTKIKFTGRLSERKNKAQSRLIISDKHASPTLTLLTAGVPCQPASIAGQRRGKSDDRWLWPEAIRVLSELQPTWAVFENPVGISLLVEWREVLKMDGKEYTKDEMAAHLFDVGEIRERTGDYSLFQILEGIEACGYEVQPVSIPACAVGAPHSRERIFIIAYARCGTRLQGNSHEAECGDRETRQISGGGSLPDTNTQVQGLQGKLATGRESTDGCTAEYTWKDDWITVATELCGLDDGSAVELDGLKLTKAKHREYRLKTLGNAVVPAQFYPILKAIADIELKGKG